MSHKDKPLNIKRIAKLLGGTIGTQTKKDRRYMAMAGKAFGHREAMNKKHKSLETEPMDEDDSEALVEMLVKYGTQGMLEELVRIGRSGRTSPESDLTWEPLADLVESIL